MHDEELLNAPSLAGQFPIEFANGFRINTILFWCTACYAVTPLANVHGLISRIIEGVADITAVTKCSCGGITKYRIRLRDDGTFSYQEGSHWVNRTTVLPMPKNILRKIKTKLAIYSLRWKYFRLLRHARNLQNKLKR